MQTQTQMARPSGESRARYGAPHPAHALTGSLGADVHRLLARLDKVKANGPGRWIACCPAHDDRSPSLAIRETGDSTILLNCFASCPTSDVLAAVGMEMHELFPKRDSDAFRTSKRPGERWVPRDVLECVAKEALIAFLAADQLARGIPLDSDDVKRLAAAAGRLRAAAEGVGYDLRR